jgi:hypothetical protein
MTFKEIIALHPHDEHCRVCAEVCRRCKQGCDDLPSTIG